MTDIVGWVVAAAALGYLLGSIPFGMVSSLIFGLGDIRKIGSGNIGATNVLRTGNKKAALMTLLLDGFKGALAVILVMVGLAYVPEQYAFLRGEENVELLVFTAGVASFLGHLFPIWLKFKGGKGVATFLGLQFALNGPMIGIAACGFWLMGWKATRISSVGALTTAVMTSGTLWIMVLSGGKKSSAALIMTGLALLLILKHHQNIQRLLAGTEPRSGEKKDSTPAVDSEAQKEQG